MPGARFSRCDLSGVVMHGVDVSGLDIDSPWVFEGDGALYVSGVNMVPFVDADFDRRFPAAPTGLPPEKSARGLGRARTHLAATLERVTAMPGPRSTCRWGAELSFAQTLRHLVMATDPGKAILRIERPYHRLGRADAAAAAEGLGMSISVTGTPPYAEVLEARATHIWAPGEACRSR